MLLAAAECARLTKAKWNRKGLAANVSELDIGIPQELTFTALCIIHNEDALKTFNYDGNKSP